LLMLFALSCQTVKLKPDPNPASIESDYLSVESSCNGNVAIGNNGCYVKIGSLGSIDLKIRTIQSGMVTIHSEMCGIEWFKPYIKSQDLKIPLSEIIKSAEKSCLLSVMVSPEYDDQEKSTVKVHGFKGEILLKSLSGILPAKIFSLSGDWDGIIPIQTRRSPHDRLEFNPGIAMDLSDSKIGFYNVIGCGKRFMGSYPDAKNTGTIFYEIDYSKSCIYHGTVIPVDTKNDTVFSAMVNVFDADYNRLEQPLIYEKNDKQILDFDKEVTFVELNDKTYNQSQLTIEDYDPEQAYTVRAYTVKGRYIKGVHDKGGFWNWYN